MLFYSIYKHVKDILSRTFSHKVSPNDEEYTAKDIKQLIPPEVPSDEPERLAKLRQLNIIDTPEDEAFDRIARIVKQIFKTDYVLITLIDEKRQWFKSHIGLNFSQTERTISFCGYTITQDNVFVVTDAKNDRRFEHNPMVINEPYVSFYAGAPIKVDGYNIGTLCLMNSEPRAFAPSEHVLLTDFAKCVADQIKLSSNLTTDHLTNLPNRQLMERQGTFTMEWCQRFDQPGTMLYLDLDDFKIINDTWGHRIGDHALVDFASILRSSARTIDLVARMAGDEFAIFAPGCTKKDATELANRIHQSINEFNSNAARQYKIKTSIGVIQYDPKKHRTIQDLLHDADCEMYLHKNQSKRKF